MDISISTEESDLSSDEELQAEFSKGLLQPGLIVRNKPKKEPTNDIAGLELQISALKRRELIWLERMDVTSTVVATTTEEEPSSDSQGVDAEDDFKREMHFFQQAQSSVLPGLKKLEELGVSYLRPEDYFAEMMKTDDHMKKVRQSLLSRQKILEQKEKARKQRELKKYGKKVQLEILQKRKMSQKKSQVEGKKQPLKDGRSGGGRKVGEKRKFKEGGKDGRSGGGKMAGEKRKFKEGGKDGRSGGGKKVGERRKFMEGGKDGVADKIRRGNKVQRGGKFGNKGGKSRGGGKKKGKPVRLGKSRRNKRK